MEIYDDDEEERKLSTIQEVSESRDISSPSMFAENCRNRSRKSISSDSDQVMDVSLNNYKLKSFLRTWLRIVVKNIIKISAE